jgi:glycosyltransferase involved in cell wall biosynthesis
MSDGMRAYARELVRRLPAVAPDLRFETFEGGDNFDVREQWGIPLEIARRKPRLVHFMAPYTPFFVPAPFVVTIHDLIDMRFPQFGKQKVQPYYRLFVRSVLQRAHRVITPDVRTRNDLSDLLGVEPSRVSVVALGVEENFGDDSSGHESTGRPYFLYAGNHRPHKALPDLFAAWQSATAASGVDLRLTGNDELGDAERYRRDDGRIVFLGNVSRQELARQYRGARAYVQPSLLEGFGLPMLEAMWCGAPVIASKSSVPAVLRDHVFSFPAGDVRALCVLLDRALAAPEEMAQVGVAGQVAARALTWERTARETADVYRSVLAP